MLKSQQESEECDDVKDSLTLAELEKISEKNRKKTVSIQISSDLDRSCSEVATRSPSTGTLSVIRRSTRTRCASEVINKTVLCDEHILNFFLSF